MLTFGSLFAGIGGLDLGLERAGLVCKWQVEINDYANKVLEKHWPNVSRFRDVRKCGRDNLESVDLICGGFPCQDVSGAGKRAGLSGERSGLWSEFARILGEFRPRYALVENVSNLLSGENGQWFGTVLADLAAIGFDAEWHCIPAAAIGAPHIRDRVFILAYPQVGGLERGSNGHILHSTPSAYRKGQSAGSGSRGCEGDVADADDAGLAQRQILRCNAAAQFEAIKRGSGSDWLSEPNVGRVVDGVPSRVDRLRSLGNAVVPQVAEWIGRRIMEADTA